MKIAILCIKDGDPTTTFGIIKDEDGPLATWSTIKEAKEFSYENILCRNSECIFIDLENINFID